MKRYKGLIVGCVSTIFFIFLSVNNAKPKVIFNFTPSIPLGIYMVKDKKSFVTGDVLVFATT
jgi:type IV secretory pathway protease TraF